MRSSRGGLTALALVLTLVACGEQASIGHGSAEEVSDWESVTTAASGQAVRWWVPDHGRLNTWVDEVAVPAAERRSVALERVPMADPSAATRRIATERRDGNTEAGTVDLVLVGSSGLVSGSQRDLWRAGWARQLPNAGSVAWADPRIGPPAGVARGAAAPLARLPLEGGRGTVYVTIPVNAKNQAGALVVADLLLEPRLQADLAGSDGPAAAGVLSPSATTRSPARSGAAG